MEHRKLGYLNVVWRFVAGLTRMQDIGWEGLRWRNKYRDYVVGSEEIALMLKARMRGSDEVRVWPSVVQCLYEAQDAGSCASVFDHSTVEYYGENCSTPFDAYAVGYCVSLHRNDWCVDLTKNGLGPGVVEMLVCGLKSVQYGGGSVRELDLSGNHIGDEGRGSFSSFLIRFFNR